MLLQEAVKVNQCKGVYFEECDFAIATDNAIDAVAIQVQQKAMGSLAVLPSRQEQYLGASRCSCWCAPAARSKEQNNSGLAILLPITSATPAGLCYAVWSRD